MIDLIVLILAGLAIFRGWQKGFLTQLLELGGGFIGLLLGLALGPRVAGMFTDQAGLSGALVSLITLFVLVSLGQAAGVVIGHRFSSFIRSHRLGPVDSSLGSGLGAVVTLVSFWLIGSLLVHGPTPQIARAFHKSRVLKAMNKVMPGPPDVLAYLQQYLDTSGFPQVFAGFPRSISPPVDLPSNAQARRAVVAAQASTVRIVVPACGGTQLGSGWISATETVVTNAHVVAGGDEVTVQELSGEEHSGLVVVYDPRTDVAVIHVEGLSGDPLDLVTETLDRGTPGATLGFPGSKEGQMETRKAAIQAQFDASGKDIYGRRDVTRDVYELRARVRQGDSGGPFVLPNGDVGGVVFAASTHDPGIGYALTGPEVQDEVAAGSSRTEETSTGSCTR